MRHLLLDTETTGLSFLNDDRVIEIAVVEYVNKKPTGNIFYHLLDPGRPIPADAVEIHGITDDHVRGKPKFRDIAADFVEFCRGGKIIAHNANFDVGMLDNELTLAGMGVSMSDIAEEIIDSLRVARALYPKMKNDLDSLIERHGVDGSSRADGHNARVDCDLLGKVYFQMTEGVDLSRLNMSKVPPRAQVVPVSRPPTLPRAQALDGEIAAQDEVLESMASSGTQPVARRLRMG